MARINFTNNVTLNTEIRWQQKKGFWAAYLSHPQASNKLLTVTASDKLDNIELLTAITTADGILDFIEANCFYNIGTKEYFNKQCTTIYVTKIQAPKVEGGAILDFIEDMALCAAHEVRVSAYDEGYKAGYAAAIENVHNSILEVEARFHQANVQ